MMRAGAGVTFRPWPQQGQAYLMRWCWMTRTCSGMMSSCSLTSAPISTRAWPSCAQMRSDSGSSWRTTCLGSASSRGFRPRFLRWCCATGVMTGASSSSSISAGLALDAAGTGSLSRLSGSTYPSDRTSTRLRTWGRRSLGTWLTDHLLRTLLVVQVAENRLWIEDMLL